MGYRVWLKNKILSTRFPKLKFKWDTLQEGYFGGSFSILFGSLSAWSIHWIFGVIGIGLAFYFVTHAMYRREKGEK